MNPVDEQNRKVANIKTATFVLFVSEDGQEDGQALQVNGRKTGYGFHIYRMTPGQTTIAHAHIGDEEFVLLDGDLTDHDGYEYKPGDIVCLKAGTQHHSTSKTGCTLCGLPAWRGRELTISPSYASRCP